MSPKASVLSSASTPCSPSAPLPTRWTWSRRNARSGRRSWSAMASTTLRRWPEPTSVWRWVRRRDRVLASSRCRTHDRPTRPARRGQDGRATGRCDRTAERRGRDRNVSCRHGRGRLRVPAACWRLLLQEGIDTAVVLNALRARHGGNTHARVAGPDAELAREFVAEHEILRPGLERLRAAADELGAQPSRRAIAEVQSVYRFLVDELAPHELAEGAGFTRFSTVFSVVRSRRPR